MNRKLKTAIFALAGIPLAIPLAYGIKALTDIQMRSIEADQAESKALYLKEHPAKIVVQETVLRKEYDLACMKKNPRPFGTPYYLYSKCEILPRKPETTLTYTL